jgi:hypothetical protein
LCFCVIYASVVVKLRLCLVRFRIGELVQWFPLFSERAHTKESRWPAGLCLQISAFYFSDSLLSVAARLQSPHQLAFFFACHTHTHTHKGPINYQISQPWFIKRKADQSWKSVSLAGEMKVVEFLCAHRFSGRLNAALCRKSVECGPTRWMRNHSRYNRNGGSKRIVFTWEGILKLNLLFIHFNRVSQHQLFD